MKIKIQKTVLTQRSLPELLLENVNDYPTVLRYLKTPGLTELDVSGEGFRKDNARDHFVHHVFKSDLPTHHKISLIDFMYMRGLLTKNRESTFNGSRTIFFAVETFDTPLVRFLLHSGERILNEDGTFVTRKSPLGWHISVFYFTEGRHLDLLMKRLFPKKIKDPEFVKWYYLNPDSAQFRTQYMLPFVERYLLENPGLIKTKVTRYIKSATTNKKIVISVSETESVPQKKHTDSVPTKKPTDSVPTKTHTERVLQEKVLRLEKELAALREGDYVSHAYFTHTTKKLQ